MRDISKHRYLYFYNYNNLSVENINESEYFTIINNTLKILYALCVNIILPVFKSILVNDFRL